MKFIMSRNLTAKRLEKQKLTRIHISTRHKPDATILQLIFNKPATLGLEDCRIFEGYNFV